MATGAYNVGEEWIFESDTEVTASILLYDDQSDSLGETADLASINSEPTGNGYSRQGTSFAVSVNANSIVLTGGSVTFGNMSFTASTQVTATGAVVSFQSDDVAGDASPSDHLVFTQSLSTSHDLQDVTSLIVDSLGGVLD
jgi:hypothetical protein